MCTHPSQSGDGDQFFFGNADLTAWQGTWVDTKSVDEGKVPNLPGTFNGNKNPLTLVTNVKSSNAFPLQEKVDSTANMSPNNISIPTVHFTDSNHNIRRATSAHSRRRSNVQKNTRQAASGSHSSSLQPSKPFFKCSQCGKETKRDCDLR